MICEKLETGKRKEKTKKLIYIPSSLLVWYTSSSSPRKEEETIGNDRQPNNQRDTVSHTILDKYAYPFPRDDPAYETVKL